MTRINQKDNSQLNFTELRNQKAAAIGRRLGLILYFVLLIFVLSAGAISIIPQIFSINRSQSSSAPNQLTCTQETQALKAELLDKLEYSSVNHKTYDIQKWLIRWNERYRATKKRCGTLQPVLIDLKTLEDRFESILKTCCGNYIPPKTN